MNLIIILFVHWFADFWLQTHEQATMKNNDSAKLAEHVGVYSVIWFGYVGLFYSPIIGLQFFLITFVAHFTTDFITSRVSKYFFDRKDFHNGFIVIGGDQILHYLQLYFTFQYLV